MTEDQGRKGPGRPRRRPEGVSTVVLRARVTEAEAERVMSRAKRFERSVSDVVREALDRLFGTHLAG